MIFLKQRLLNRTLHRLYRAGLIDVVLDDNYIGFKVREE